MLLQCWLNDFLFHFYVVRNLTERPFYLGVGGEDLWMFWTSNFECLTNGGTLFTWHCIDNPPLHKQIFVLLCNKAFLRNIIQLNCNFSMNISESFEVLIVVLLKIQVLWIFVPLFILILTVCSWYVASSTGCDIMWPIVKMSLAVVVCCIIHSAYYKNRTRLSPSSIIIVKRYKLVN